MVDLPRHTVKLSELWNDHLSSFSTEHLSERAIAGDICKWNEVTVEARPPTLRQVAAEIKMDNVNIGDAPPGGRGWELQDVRGGELIPPHTPSENRSRQAHDSR